ncbi:hypothetical protein [Pseudoalteromonas luteoviolacea]|uniref:Uncharacterized protein n=1 Tax=Pseudoalteromonas luteoviolacea (strain 2ta16) TaxID=1353533 RepID=V4JCM9_PSEL2|nr:hypothetical protein [Pseudoalteromonas luteoviolacea]ESP92817.1 hypothetical protein PL2TA16_04015 [Pseudoalteromonas luteoviolacea 2ta16]KZN35629.1 hypothetical protein N483_01330 [Pseudoalteromonas luteoviolacea NCIMB 1944]
MSKSNITKVKIEEALNRILQGHPRIIHSSQKLSVKAVEEEAGLGSGSVYYYPELVSIIKAHTLKTQKKSQNNSLYEEKISSLQKKLKNEKRLKEKYRLEIIELKSQLSSMASQHNQLALIIQQYQFKINELENLDKVHRIENKDR